MESFNNEIDVWQDLKSFDILYKKVQNIINSQQENSISFSLSLYSFDLSTIELNYSSYIKLKKQISTYLHNMLNDNAELFDFEKDKIISLHYNKNIPKNLSKKFAEKIFEIEEIEISFNPKIVTVQWPKDGKKFDELIKNLFNKLKKQIDEKNEINFPKYPDNIIMNKNNEYLDKVEKDSTQLYLIAKNNNIEIIKQHIIADRAFQITAGKNGDFELFYILEGEISHEDTDTILTRGDSIIAKSGDKEKYFKTLTDITLLYITSTPIFASEQKRINDLISLNEQVAEKDVETNEHCKRLQELSQLTAIELGLEEKKIFNIGYASFLHDIGKAKVPKSMLLKPEKLTDKEWETMKKHTKWGKEIILNHFNLEQFRKVAQIIYQHHERYDGNGYPQGLSGDQILIEAQILSVVDAYDAMIYERPYQRALTRKEAIEEIKREKGKQFSPRAVEAFLKAEKKFYKGNQ